MPDLPPNVRRLQPIHYAEKAARKFLKGLNFHSPQEAIDAGYRTNDQWEDFMKGETKMFWSRNGQKARRKVKGRHPMKRVRKQRKMGENASISVQSVTIDSKKRTMDVLALENRAKEFGEVGGSTQTRIDKQARLAYSLYLDFARHAIGGDYSRWLSKHSGLDHVTCRRRLLAGVALALGATNRNQAGLLAEMRERKDQARLQAK